VLPRPPFSPLGAAERPDGMADVAVTWRAASPWRLGPAGAGDERRGDLRERAEDCQLRAGGALRAHLSTSATRMSTNRTGGLRKPNRLVTASAPTQLRPTTVIFTRPPTWFARATSLRVYERQAGGRDTATRGSGQVGDAEHREYRGRHEQASCGLIQWNEP
jgi:hypothetical protein